MNHTYPRTTYVHSAVLVHFPVLMFTIHVYFSAAAIY